jgi:hypothetical protein
MPGSVRLTTSDLEDLPALDGVRYEIIDGEDGETRPDSVTTRRGSAARPHAL